MNKKIAQTKKCRNCGKEFEACRQSTVNGAIKWKSILCSDICKKQYEKAILISRGTEPGVAALLVDCEEGLTESEKKIKKSNVKRIKAQNVAEAHAVIEKITDSAILDIGSHVIDALITYDESEITDVEEQV